MRKVPKTWWFVFWQIPMISFAFFGGGCKSGHQSNTPKETPEPIEFQKEFAICTSCKLEEDVYKFEDSNGGEQIDLDCKDFGEVWGYEHPGSNPSGNCSYGGIRNEEDYIIFLRKVSDKASPNVLSVYIFAAKEESEQQRKIFEIRHKYFFRDPVLNCKNFISPKDCQSNVNLDFWIGMGNAIIKDVSDSWEKLGLVAFGADTFFQQKTQYRFLRPELKTLPIWAILSEGTSNQKLPFFGMNLDLTAYFLFYDKKATIKDVCPEASSLPDKPGFCEGAIFLNYAMDIY